MRSRKATVILFGEIRREVEFGLDTIQGVAQKIGVHRRLDREAIRRPFRERNANRRKNVRDETR